MFQKKILQAKILDMSILALILYLLLLFLNALVGEIYLGASVFELGIVLLSVLLLRHQLNRGKVVFVGNSLILLAFTLISLSVVRSGTVHTPLLSFYFFPIVIGGALYQGKGIFFTNIISSLVVTGLSIAENLGFLPAHTQSITFTNWLTYNSFFWLSSYFVHHAYRTINQALNEAEKENLQRKSAETSLKENEKRWQFALESVNDGLWDWNAETNEVYYSSSWKTMLGYAPEEIGNDLSEWDKRIHQEDRERTYEILNQHLKGETELYICEHRILCKDGTYKWILDRGKVISRTEDGEPLRAIGTHTDITHRKKIENSLRESEIRYRALFDQTNDAVFILDLKGRHKATNQRAAEMLGYTMEEIIGLSVKDTSAEMDQSQNVANRILAGEKIPPYERLFRKKNGDVLPVEINAELITDEDGNPLHIQSVVRDISQRKLDEEKLKNANLQLSTRIKEIEALQNELQRQALHDPLTGLYNRRYLSDMLERELQNAQKYHTSFSVIILDIDLFKNINDTYGHQIGDQVLIALASLLVNFTRNSDIACRYGGEEFLVVLLGTDAQIAMQRAEELREKCQKLTLAHENKEIKLTASFGVATYPDHGMNVDQLLSKADKALYKSKKLGRNRVTLWSKDTAADIGETSNLPYP